MGEGSPGWKEAEGWGGGAAVTPSQNPPNRLPLEVGNLKRVDGGISPRGFYPANSVFGGRRREPLLPGGSEERLWGEGWLREELA